MAALPGTQVKAQVSLSPSGNSCHTASRWVWQSPPSTRIPQICFFLFYTCMMLRLDTPKEINVCLPQQLQWWDLPAACSFKTWLLLYSHGKLYLHATEARIPVHSLVKSFHCYEAAKRFRHGILQRDIFSHQFRAILGSKDSILCMIILKPSDLSLSVSGNTADLHTGTWEALWNVSLQSQ